MPTPIPIARRLRRIAAGVSLIAFAALLVPQALIDPAEGGTGEVMVRAATEQRGALITSMLLLMVSGALMVPAASGVLHQARDRGAAVANIGAVLFVLGGFAHLGMGFFYLATTALPGGDRGEMVAFIDRLNDSVLLGAVVFPLILCFGLGVAILPWGAWRAGAVHWWVPALASAVLVAHLALPEDLPHAGTVTAVALTVAYTALGLQVLRQSDTEWDGVHPTRRTPAPAGV